jgi:hypothetical protein
MESTPRKRRHSRSRSNGPYIITAKKVELLTVLARYKYLRSTYLSALLDHRSQDGLRRSLRSLYDNGLIDKPEAQLRGYNSLYTPDIYCIDTKGIDTLAERGISPDYVTHLHRQKNDAPVHQFAHDMMICDTLASIEVGCREAGLRFIPWTEIIARTTAPKPMKLACTVAHDFGTHRENFETHLVPDALFGVQYRDGKVAFFALECERRSPKDVKKLTRSSSLKKLIGYRDIIRRGEYKDQLAIRNLRVLMVAPTPTMMRNILDLAERVVGPSPVFLFNVMPVQEDLYKAPPPNPALFTDEWHRSGMPPIRLDE